MSTPTPNVQNFPPVTAADLAAHTEQALVELIYVGTGNQMLGSALNTLESALNTTQSVLNILQNLQNLHNNISVKSKSAFGFNYKLGPSAIYVGHNPSLAQTAGVTPPGGTISTRVFVNSFITISSRAGPGQRFTIHLCASITDYQRAYNSAASAYFGQAINPFFVFANSAASGYSNFLTALTQLKSRLATEIQVLSGQTPSGARGDPTSLLGTVRQVYNDLPANFQFSTVEKWALDNYTSHGSTGAAAGGVLQNNLSTAIVAAENLNDTQKEKVRRYLFIFQEYYQSASAILSSITQIVQKMAQKISQ